MKAEEIYGSIYPRIKELNRNQKIRLCSLIAPDLKVRQKKRGRVITEEEAKKKLRKDFLVAYEERKQTFNK